MVRFFKHLMWPEWRLKYVLDSNSRKRIAEAVLAAEIGHKAEIKVFIEGSFSWRELYLGISTHDKALDIFSLHRVWDTAHNTGILLYVLVADRKVELIFDRGLLSVFSNSDAKELAGKISSDISKNGLTEGVISGVKRLHSEFHKKIPSLDEISSDKKLTDDVIVSG